MKKIFMLIIVGLVLASCTAAQSQPTSSPTQEEAVIPTDAPQAGLPNPASVYCEEQGYTVEIRTAADGSQSGVCLFPDGSECDEWAFFRGECSPPSQGEAEPSSTAEIVDDGWQVYRNETLGYHFQYPANAQIIANDEPLNSITVEGPLVEDEHWPQFTISHPTDREEYLPPEDIDLAQWLVDHNLLSGDRQPDVTIAGIPAIHVRNERSPQSFAYDRYFFARSGQLYMIVIGHVGDLEDWSLYQHFLDSFQFDQQSSQIPTALPIDPALYEGWWTYTHPGYGFSLLLPEDWQVEETGPGDPLLNGHMLNLHSEGLNIRMTFRRVGEEVLLWPTGVGEGEFIQQGTLDIAGRAARRMLLVCPSGEVTSLWYLGTADEQPNFTAGDLEFAFIISAGEHCQPGASLGGKIQLLGEMILASLQVK